MRLKLSATLFAALCLGVVAPAPSFGTPVTGTLNITGDATVTAVALNFLCDILSPMSANSCPANYGNFIVTGPAAQSGSFVSVANTSGLIQSLNATTTPINQGFSLPNFITFTAAPDMALDLNYIYAGTGGACPPAGSATCTPMVPALVSPSNPTGLSPFNLANTANGSSASFSVAGQTRRVSTGETAAFNGTFTAQFTSTPGTNDADVAHILAIFAAAGQITTSYSSTFVATTVPEPASTSLMIGGLLILASAGLKRFSAKR